MASEEDDDEDDDEGDGNERDFLMYHDSAGSAVDQQPHRRDEGSAAHPYMYRHTSFAQQLAEYRAAQLSRFAGGDDENESSADQRSGSSEDTAATGVPGEAGVMAAATAAAAAATAAGSRARRPVVRPPTTLFEAVERKDHTAIARFIQEGWDVNEQNQYGETPLHIAVTADDHDAVALLLQANANLEMELNLCGWTPLHKAAARGDLRMVKMLVAFGADVNRTKSDGLDAAALAERNEHMDVQAFLEQQRHSATLPPMQFMASLCMRCAACIRHHFLHRKRMAIDELALPEGLKRWVNGGVDFPRVPAGNEQHDNAHHDDSSDDETDGLEMSEDKLSNALDAHSDTASPDAMLSSSSTTTSSDNSRHGGGPALATALVSVGVLCAVGWAALRYLRR